MHHLALYILAFTAFTQLLRYSQLRGASTLYVCAVNYVVALAVSALLLWGSEYGAVNAPLVALAFVNGILFFVHLLVLMASYNHAGVGITQAVSVSGCVIPILVSWVLWPAANPMSPAQWTAVALLPVALFLMRPVSAEKHYLNLKDDVILLLPFFMTGGVNFIHKYATMRFDKPGQVTYQVVLFSFAALSAWLYIAFRKPYRGKNDVVVGSAVGIVNAFALLFMMYAIDRLPAGKVFTISSSGGIASSLIVSWLLWKERITARQAVGIGVAVLIVILASQRAGVTVTS